MQPKSASGQSGQVNTQHRIHDHVSALLAHLLPTAEHTLPLKAETLGRPL
jgi:hypothetical protein